MAKITCNGHKHSIAINASEKAERRSKMRNGQCQLAQVGESILKDVPIAHANRRSTKYIRLLGYWRPHVNGYQQKI